MSERVKILIVDDDLVTCNTLSVILEKNGYDVSVAYNGVEAKEQIETKHFNVVILDIKLPDISGMELLKVAKEKDSEIMVIMITAFAAIETSIQAMNEGAFTYITKPYNVNEVTAVIRKALEEQRLSMENKRLIRDLTRTNKELKRTQDKLIQSAKLAAAGSIASEAAHEIKSPLTIISTAITLIEDDVLLSSNEEMLKRIEMIKRAVGRIKKFVDNLLNLSRPIKYNFKPHSINEIIERVIQERQDLSKGIKVEKSLSSGLPEVFSDADRLGDVFVNLLSNASEAMPDGGNIWIKTQRSEDGKKVEIYFEDTGCGIPEKDIYKIFDPFFTTKGKGMGLGIAIIKKIVEEHKGTLEIRSKVGKGTLFIIRLPAIIESVVDIY